MATPELLRRHRMSVTAPTAGVGADGTERTAVQGAATEVEGLFFPLTPKQAIETFDMPAARPHQLITVAANAGLLVPGGTIRNVTDAATGRVIFAGPFYIVTAPSVYAAGLSVDNVFVLCDTEPPRDA